MLERTRSAMLGEHTGGLPSTLALVAFAALVALAPVACAARDAPPGSPSRLPSEIQILTQKEMEAVCQIDPAGMCQEFRTPPIAAVARFEDQLERLLRREGYERLVGDIRTYVRQYWATVDDGQLFIHGSFVCRSVVETGAEAFGPLPDGAVQGPHFVDDAGDCHLTAVFPVDSPRKVEFYR